MTAVVVNHDGGDLTIACLESLRAQDYPAGRLHLVLVDTDSTDGVADRVRAAWPEVDVVEAGVNLGFAGGVNLGVRHAPADNHIALLNPDATAEPDWLRLLTSAMDSGERIGAVNAKVLFAGTFREVAFDTAVEIRGARQAGYDVWDRLQFVTGWRGPGYERGVPYQWCTGPAVLRIPDGAPVELLVATETRGPSWAPAPPGGPPRDVINSVGLVVTPDGYGADRGYLEVDEGQYDQRSDVFAWTGSAVLLRREYLDLVGPLDEALFLYYEDLDHAWRGRATGWRYLCEPAAVAHHVHQASARQSALTDILIERNRLVILRRHAGRRRAVNAAIRHLLVTASYLRRDVVLRTAHGRRPSLVVVRRRVRALAEAVPFIVRSAQLTSSPPIERNARRARKRSSTVRRAARSLPLRIGFDGTPLLGPRTGIGWYTAELVSALSGEAPESELLILPISWRTARHLEINLPNATVVRRFMPARPLQLLWDRTRVPPLEWFLQCDVFHATNFMGPPTSRTPVVVTVHDLAFVRHPETCVPAVRAYAHLLPPVLRRAAGIITVSEFTATELRDWLPEVADRIEVIPNGGHKRASPTSTGLPPGPPYVLSLGSLGKRKNLPLLLDAYAALRRSGVNVRLVLAGPPDPLVDVPTLLRKRGIRDGVVVTGYVDDGRAAALLRDAAALAFPSLYEGFGMPLIEAMAVGTPVVAVRSGATPETVGDAALLVEPGDVEGFAAGLATLLDDAAIKNDLVEAGYRRAGAFSWSRTATATMSVYRRVTG